jgi:hypothetical protein
MQSLNFALLGLYLVPASFTSNSLDPPGNLDIVISLNINQEHDLWTDAKSDSNA